MELNSPIVEEEVLRVIANLKQGKAAGVDMMINEILKFGGEGIGRATARLCEALFRLESTVRLGARFDFPSVQGWRLEAARKLSRYHSPQCCWQSLYLGSQCKGNAVV